MNTWPCYPGRMTGPVSTPAMYAQGLYSGMTTGDYGSPAPLVNPGPPTDYDGMGGPEDLGAAPRGGSVLLMDALKALEASRASYLVADQMYNGELGDIPMSPTLVRLMNRSGVQNVEDLCYTRVPVDTIAQKLGIRAVTIAPQDTPDDQDELDEDDLAASDAAIEQSQDALDAVRKHNQMDIAEAEMMLKVAKYGDCYLEVWPVQDAPVDAEDAFDGTVPVPVGDPGPVPLPMVDIYVNSPYTVRAFYDPAQPLLMTHVIKAWEWVDPEDLQAQRRQRATIYTQTHIERWVCKQEGSPDRPEDWQPFIEGDEEWPAPYPAGVDRIPFFHERNAWEYGQPEHKPGYGAQRIINKLVQAHAVTIDFQIFPQRYALLDPKADQMLVNLLDPDNPEDDDDDPEGAGHSQFRADPAALWKIYAQAVGQFSPPDPNTFLAPFDRYIKAISELCGIPLDRFTGYTTPPSGESRRVGNEVLYEKVDDRRTRLGGTLTDAYEFALELLGFTGVEVSIKWKPLDVAAGADDWNVVASKIANGVPNLNALVEAGYDEDEVRGWLLDQGGADLVRRVALLNSIGTAVQALAAGVGVGMVSKEQAGDLVARVMGQIGEDLPETKEPVTIEQPPAVPQAGGPPGQQGGPPHGGPPPGEPNPNAGPPAGKPAGLIPMPPVPQPPMVVGRD